MTKLSASQKSLLLEVAAASEGLVVENRSTAAASLKRLGLVTKEFTMRPAPPGSPAARPGGGNRALLHLTTAGHEWVKAHGDK